jgi:hypothetical protein
MLSVTEDSIDEQIRLTVALSIETGAVLDVAESADIIARAHGCRGRTAQIFDDIAVAAAKAKVPMKLTARSAPFLVLTSKPTSAWSERT